MKNCLVISASEEIFRCPERYSPAGMFLILYTHLILSEIQKNGYAFSLPLRFPCETVMGLNLVTAKYFDKQAIRLTRLYSYRSYASCRDDSDLDDLDFISRHCDHRRLLAGHPDDDLTQAFCGYCRDETDLLFLVHPADRLDAETAAVLGTAQQKNIPVFRLDPETFEILRSSLPPDWIIPEGDFSEKDILESFPPEKV